MATSGQEGCERIAATIGPSGGVAAGRAPPRRTIRDARPTIDLDELRLADPRLAADEDDATAPPPRRPERLAQPLCFMFAPDELVPASP